MKLTAIIGLIILSFILNYLIKKYVKLSMFLITTFIMLLTIFVDIALINAVFLSNIFAETFNIYILLILLIIIAVSILPFILIKDFISHTIRIIDYFFNKNKILKYGITEKGIIKNIQHYNYGVRSNQPDGYYLIVDFNGQKIKSLPFKKIGGGILIKTTYQSINNNGTQNFTKERQIWGEMPQLYNIGDEIEVIIYNKKKYVKINDF